MDRSPNSSEPRAHGRSGRALARLGHGPRAVALGLLVSFVATAPEAHATFGPEGFETEEISAHTLRAEELKVGPSALRYGLFGEAQIGTIFPLNLVGVFNADAKWRIAQLPGFALAAESGFYHFDSSFVGVDGDFALTAVPVKLAMSFPASPHFQFHARLSYLYTEPSGPAPDTATRLVRHFGPVGRFAGEIYLEWRLGAHVAVVLDYAFPFVMHEAALLYEGEDPDDRLGMMRVAGSLVATFDTFNVRLGVGYGPSFLGEAGVFPTFDLFWRIY